MYFVCFEFSGKTFAKSVLRTFFCMGGSTDAISEKQQTFNRRHDQPHYIEETSHGQNYRICVSKKNNPYVGPKCTFSVFYCFL